MNKLSAIDLLGSHTFDHFKTSDGWKEKENKWGIKKYITDEGMFQYVFIYLQHDMYNSSHDDIHVFVICIHTHTLTHSFSQSSIIYSISFYR